MRCFFAFLISLQIVGGAILAHAGSATTQSKAKLLTPWTQQARANDASSEYPRPSMVRSNWLSLNGDWSYKLTSFTGPAKVNLTGTIRVPFPIESYLSGVEHKMTPYEQLDYQRTFTVPKRWNGKRILLHFGAVNWESRVSVNGTTLGVHQGGYDKFSYDITDALTNKSEQTLLVSVKNPAENGTQPRGKQTTSPHGIWYTASSGIWQTVWLEPVPTNSIVTTVLSSDVDESKVGVLVIASGATNELELRADIFDGTKNVCTLNGTVGEKLTAVVKNPKLWSPEQPFLYDVKITLLKSGQIIDSVSSYLGMRKISVAKDKAGHPRICLNNSPYFQLGVLDQGFWPDGIYTAPTDEALRSDIETTRRLGFNVCRKHVKVEPERWYYWCDKMGLLVWQDMPSAGKFNSPTPKDSVWSAVREQEFQTELNHVIEQNQNHPSVVMWIAFNEGWGQHDTLGVINKIKELDSSRLVVGASGWNDRGGGDVVSLHKYPGPAMPEFKDRRAVVCGECGGLGFAVPSHVWPGVPSWSYTHFDSQPALTNSYDALLNRIMAAREAGLSAAIITQLSDVESEINGFVSYDRQTVKLGSIKGKFSAWNQ